MSKIKIGEYIKAVNDGNSYDNIICNYYKIKCQVDQFMVEIVPVAHKLKNGKIIKAIYKNRSSIIGIGDVEVHFTPVSVAERILFLDE